MVNPVGSRAVVSARATGAGWSSALLSRAMRVDVTARAAGYGRWWFDARSGGMVLSLEAAHLLGEHPGLHLGLADCFASVLPEDLSVVTKLLLGGLPAPGSAPRSAPGSEQAAPKHWQREQDSQLQGSQAQGSQTQGSQAQGECECRMDSGAEGLRCLRLVLLPADAEQPGGLRAGIVSDVTAAKHAAMREVFSFESTQLMIGTHTLDEAVGKMIALVCNDLGWDFGIYWAMAHSGPDAGRLVCTHFWSGSARIAPDSAGGQGLRRPSMGPDEGVVGAVWSSGQPRWIEEVASDPEFLYPQYARQSGIHAGYAFPVAYESEDGVRHRPGVLIFFSCLARQRTAQLPNLSAAIGALIAQTAQRMAQQESIRQLAQVDALSGLANRRHFHDLLDAACQHAGERGVAMGMLYIDLDRFKPINDGLGHEVGDVVLRQFSARLAALVPSGGHAGRVGGDEFALFLFPGDAPERLQAIAEQVLAAARTRFLVDGRELAISASVGISVFPDDGTTGADLLRHADSAMYRVKRAGRNGVSFFSQEGQQQANATQSALLQQLTVEAELLHALADGQFFMEYQPVFALHGCLRRVRAVEALIRWRRPDGSIVPPDLFIPIAEQSHLIVDIGRWVIRQACADLPRMHAGGLAGIQLNVNMAALEFLNANLPQELAAIADQAGIDARHVCLELTEGMMMNHAEQVVPVMRELRKRGFRISVDDFGMGYSSLSRLKDLPISSLKIDRSFVHGLPGDQQDGAIVRSIVDIGRNMGLDVIAEGVETEAQLEHLDKLGCSLVQGFLTGRPMGLAELIRIHGAQAPLPATGLAR